MTKKISRFETKTIIAALKLAAKKPWEEITLEQIAKAAKVPSPQIRQKFADTNALLPAIVSHIDSIVVQAIGKIDKNTQARDRLFEVMIARFDALQAHRQSILSIMSACKTHPSMAFLLFQSLMASMQQVLFLAQVTEKNIPITLQKTGILLIYQTALKCWESDTSSDMAPTMARLDKSLHLGEKIAACFA